MLTTSFTRLVGCRAPIQLAPMPIVTLELAMAIAEAGGLAMLSALRAPASYLVDTIEKVTSHAGAAVGVNFVIRFLNRDTLKAVATRVKVVEFFYGDPDPALVDLVHTSGALAAWHIGSIDEAIAAERCGCDLIAVQGIEAGGHVRGHLGLFPLLAQVLDVVQIPVVASGGIGTARSMAAALAAGAAAVRVGTRFLAAQESGAHPEYVQALLRARGEDTVLTEAFAVNWPDAPHRVLRSCVDAATSLADEMVGQGSVGGVTYQVPRLAPPTPNRETVGNIEAMPLYAGQSVDAVRRIQPAADIVRELSEGAERLLRSCV